MKEARIISFSLHVFFWEISVEQKMLIDFYFLKERNFGIYEIKVKVI
jgi:hypothetical protein